MYEVVYFKNRTGGWSARMKWSEWNNGMPVQKTLPKVSASSLEGVWCSVKAAIDALEENFQGFVVCAEPDASEFGQEADECIGRIMKVVETFPGNVGVTVEARIVEAGVCRVRTVFGCLETLAKDLSDFFESVMREAKGLNVDFSVLVGRVSGEKSRELEGVDGPQPCLWCGGDVLMASNGLREAGRPEEWFANCGDCGVRGPIGESAAEAVERWNDNMDSMRNYGDEDGG